MPSHGTQGRTAPRARPGAEREHLARRALPILALVLAGALIGCGGSDDPGPDEGRSETAVSEYGVETIVDDLPGPTQLAWHPDGRLLVALLGAGGEGSETGRIVAVDIDAPSEPDVLVDGLDTPTGLAVAGDELWIMERTRLVTAPLAGGVTTVVREDLPNNGRSNGSLTVTSEGRLLYDTSGRQEGTRAADGTGVLWSLDPDNPDDGDTPVLAGMKHAYAAAEDGRGGLLVTEIGDGTYDGERPPDEVVVVGASGGPESDDDGVPDGGWPRCVGDRDPVAENEGSAEWCERAVPSLALFEPGATPTGVAVAPWDTETAVVALWQSGELAQLPIVRAPGEPPVQATAVLSDLDGPQHLLPDGDRLLLSVHGQGAVVAVTPG